jgi:hypothetical protein
MISFEFCGIETSESGDGEGPAFFAGTEGDGSLGGFNLQFTHILLLIGRDDNVDHINDSDEILIHLFTV